MPLLKNILLSFLILFGNYSGYSQIILNKAAKDILISRHNAYFGITSDRDSNYYWIKINVNKSTSDNFLLECLSPHMEDLFVEMYKDGTILNQYKTGASYKFNKRPLLHKNYVFPIPQEIGNYTILVGIKNPLEHELYFKIRSFSFFTEYAIYEYFFLGSYYGILCIVFFYNFFLFIKSKSDLYIKYALYIIGCLLLSVKEDGIGYQFLWSEWPEINTFIVRYAAKPIFLITFLIYALVFLEVKKYHNKIGKYLGFMVVVYAVCSIISYWIPTFVLLSEILFFLVFLSIYIISLLIARKGNTFAYYFLAGFSIIVISVLINILRLTDVLPSNILTVYIFNYGIILEIVIFSIALAERVRLIQFEKETHKEHLLIQLHKNDLLQKELIVELEDKKSLQDKVNRELEFKVKERTSDLEKANLKLVSLAQELDKLNSELDKYNYKLKKEIKEEKISRIYNQEISYEQFLESYPDDEACLKAIQDIKWPRGFKCKKCGYDKFSNASVWYRKKCNKCGYIESITSNTLFHHLKFPLNKAFYLAYVEYAKAEFTNEELSHHISLRKPTVWAFRNKVSERMQDKKYQKITNWKGMILD